MHKKLGIKSWALEDRPREKLLLNGRHALTDAELLAVLLGSGNKNENAVELAKRMLNKADNSLHKIAQWEIADFTQFEGVGEAKAITVISALEIGRRRKDAEIPKRTKITSSKDAYSILHSVMLDLPYEEFWILHLNRANQVLAKEKIGQGGVSGTVADVRIILKSAINKLTSGLILAHNHPSGNLQPSNADKQLTEKIKNACRLLDISLLDHLIITNNSYFSFADNGLL
jgi:DNA repair protein RadC